MFFQTEHKEAPCLLEKCIRKQPFSFSFLHFGGIFWAPIMFKHYYFQSGCNPVNIKINFMNCNGGGHNNAKRIDEF